MNNNIKNMFSGMAIMLLICACSCIKPQKIYSERECEMSREKLIETITSILKMNNFDIVFDGNNMISAESNSDINFEFNPLYNNRTKVEKYHIKWDFIISNLPNTDNKFKVISSCYKINNSFRANLSLKNPQMNYNENTFPVGKHYRRGNGDAVLYYAIIDALRHICGMEIEHYRDEYDRELWYDIEGDKFYILNKK